MSNRCIHINKASGIALVLCLVFAGGCSKKNVPKDQEAVSPSGAAVQQDAQPSIQPSAPSLATESVGPVQGSGAAPAAPAVPGAKPGAPAAPLIAPGIPVAPGLPGAPAVAPIPSGTPKAAAEVKKEPEPECFSIAFRHKKVGGHSSNEDCSHHKNLLRLKHKNVNPAAICVRVNARPVAFKQVKGAASDLLIGSIAGPEAKILVSYCVNKARCNDECKVPRDEFMDAIGGSEEESAKAGKWDSGDANARDVASAKMDAEIRKEMADIDAEEDVFADWIGDAETVLVCQLKAKPKAKH